MWKDDRLFWIAESSEYLFQGVHRRYAGAGGDEPHLLRHAIDPMASLPRTDHQHRVAPRWLC